jgi:hypothetical protein
MATNRQNTNDIFRCLDSDSRNCDDISLTTDPNISFQALRARNNAAFREKGTSKDNTATNPGFFFDQRNVITNIGGETSSTLQQLTPGSDVDFSFDSNFDLISGETPAGESLDAVDVGGTRRDGSPNIPEDQSFLDQSRIGDQKIKIEGGNRVFPYITPLASTNFNGLENIDPLGIIDNGNDGTLYSPQLLEDEGIIYLRQYLSFDDEETGAVWRFQYAPKITYNRSATFQEDKTWGTNVQPTHFNNTSGKKVSIQNAILEGMTIGRTVTGAVQALETLMSVVNPDNEEQVAPYAYRLIVGKRTFTEPISQRHSPFIIEQVTVREELYDTDGEVLMYKVDISLREVPYYQINDGRKLLLVTQDQRTNAQLDCDSISEQMSELTAEILNRETSNNNRIDAFRDGANDRNDAIKNIENDASVFVENCQADSKAYSDMTELIRQYNDRNCKTSKNVEGLRAIERQFARKSGIYEILLGRPSEINVGIIDIDVFDENGNEVRWRDQLAQISAEGQVPVGADGLPSGPRSGQDYLSGINSALVDGTQTFVEDPKNYLKSCPHIFCVSERVQNNTSSTNLDNIFAGIDNLLSSNGSVIVEDLIRDDFTIDFLHDPGAKKLLFPNADDNKNKTAGRFRGSYWICASGSNSDIPGNQNVRRSVQYGITDNGGILSRTLNLASVRFPKGFNLFRRDKYKDNRIQASVCYILVEKILEETIFAAEDRRKAKCNVKAVRNRLADSWIEYIERAPSIFDSIIDSTVTASGGAVTRAFIIEQIEDNRSPCSAFSDKASDFRNKTYRGCMAARSIIISAKRMRSKLSSVATISDPFSEISVVFTQ